MPNNSYDVRAYNSILQFEIKKLGAIGILLLLILVAMIVYSIILIREDRTRKFPYIQLVGIVVISAFLITSFVSSIISYSKDIIEEAYIQYEGPASISKKRKVILGNIPTWYNEYIVSFYNNGELVELSTRKDYEIEGDIENLYIIYAQNSGEIFEFIE